MNNDDLSDKLNKLHGTVTDKLEERFEDDKWTIADLTAALRLLKQNNIVVTVKPVLTSHTNQLEAAKKKAEAASKTSKTPFGYKQGKA